MVGFSLSCCINRCVASAAPLFTSPKKQPDNNLVPRLQDPNIVCLRKRPFLLPVYILPDVAFCNEEYRVYIITSIKT